MNQQTAYNENSYCIPAMRRHLNNASRQQETYTKEEKRLFEILSKTNKNTIIGLSINKRLHCRGVGSFREMIKELSEQARDARNELIRSIGKEAVELIERVS